MTFPIPLNCLGFLIADYLSESSRTYAYSRGYVRMMVPRLEIMPAKFPKYFRYRMLSGVVDLYILVIYFLPKLPAVNENASPENESRILAKFPFHKALIPFSYLIAV